MPGSSPGMSRSSVMLRPGRAASLPRRRHHRRDLIEPGADMLDESARRRFRHAEHAQRIEPARALDADRVPEEAADMSDLGDVGERQMLVDAPPRGEPEINIAGGDADLIGAHAGGKQDARAVEMKQSPQPARAHGDAGGSGESLGHRILTFVVACFNDALSIRSSPRRRGPSLSD